jgi:hypothetical protein
VPGKDRGMEGEMDDKPGHLEKPLVPGLMSLVFEVWSLGFFTSN